MKSRCPLVRARAREHGKKHEKEQRKQGQDVQGQGVAALLSTHPRRMQGAASECPLGEIQGTAN
jgi:hypothetical protein